MGDPVPNPRRTQREPPIPAGVLGQRALGTGCKTSPNSESSLEATLESVSCFHLELPLLPKWLQGWFRFLRFLN